MPSREWLPTTRMSDIPASSSQEELQTLDLLLNGDLSIEGRLVGASNATLRARVTDGSREAVCVVKPVAGERPLWDFPDSTLTGREVAAYHTSEALGWGLVPPTVWRDETPVGPGMVQLWINEIDEERPVDVVSPSDVPEGWLAVLEARDQDGRPVVLVHAADPSLMRMAAFDAVVNNADRKGGHVLADELGALWAIDHGVTFSDEGKLRTVLWGWAGEALPEDVREDLAKLGTAMKDGIDPIDRYLSDVERAALRERVTCLVDDGRFPLPSAQWPAVPWPVF